MSNLIATTAKVDIHALAFQGIMVYTTFPQIRDMLMRRFGEEYVLLFAKPVENKGDNQIDWYSPVQGPAQKLKELPPEESEPIYEKISRMANEIANFAEELISSGDPLKITRGNILKLSLCYPNNDCLYVVGRQPVFICWGFGPGTPGVEGMNLTRLYMARPVKAPTPQPEPAKPVAEEPVAQAPAPIVMARPVGTAWAWWLLPILPLLLLLLLLFTRIGNLPPLGGYELFHISSMPFFTYDEEKDMARIAKLENEIGQLHVDLQKHVAQCAPVAQAPKPAPKQELVIPKDAKDTSFLAGSWICETGLVNSRTKEPIRFIFSFDKNGVGQGVVLEKQDRCVGKARATLNNGRLRVELGRQECANAKSAYSAEVIECANAANNATECKGKESTGTTWEANFRRYE